MSIDENPNESPERLTYYERIRDDNLAPLWQVFNSLITKQPKSDCQAHLWRYSVLRERLLEAGNPISAKEAERRVLILETSGFASEARITTSLFRAFSWCFPAKSHRRTDTANRPCASSWRKEVLSLRYLGPGTITATIQTHR